jgi:hypothetical protein
MTATDTIAVAHGLYLEVGFPTVTHRQRIGVRGAATMVVPVTR